MKILGWFIVVLVVTLGTFYGASNVQLVPTESDIAVSKKMEDDIGVSPLIDGARRDFNTELEMLKKVILYFDSVTANSKQSLIPMGHSRELDAWYESKTGICSDVSRAAELFLTYLGFKVRHVSIYSLVGNVSPYMAAITYRNPSHAVTEVLTSRGWLLFDAHFGRLYLDTSGNPVSVSRMHLFVQKGLISKEAVHVIFHEPYLAVYGLYSRHGMFYPPYVPSPDIAWLDFLQSGCCEVVK